MVKLTQLGEQDEADGKRGKTGGLCGQPKFGGGVQEQEGDGDVFIDDVGDEYGVFQTAAAMFRCTCARSKFKSPVAA